MLTWPDFSRANPATKLFKFLRNAMCSLTSRLSHLMLKMIFSFVFFSVSKRGDLHLTAITYTSRVQPINLAKVGNVQGRDRLASGERRCAWSSWAARAAPLSARWEVLGASAHPIRARGHREAALNLWLGPDVWDDHLAHRGDLRLLIKRL